MTVYTVEQHSETSGFVLDVFADFADAFKFADAWYRGRALEPGWTNCKHGRCIQLEGACSDGEGRLFVEERPVRPADG